MIFLALCISISSWTTSPVDWVKQLYSDTEHVVTAPTRWDRNDWLNFSLAVGATGGLMLVDESIRDFAQRNRNSTSQMIANLSNPMGSEGAAILLGTMYLAGHISNDEELKRTAILGGESAIISGGIVWTFKILLGRNRPDKGNGAFAFSGPSLSSSNHSLPSGHVSTAFSIAACIADNSENQMIDVLAYGVATTVGFSRIYKDRHWSSDVFVGALIGAFVGKTLVRLKKITE